MALYVLAISISVSMLEKRPLLRCRKYLVKKSVNAFIIHFKKKKIKKKDKKKKKKKYI